MLTNPDRFRDDVRRVVGPNERSAVGVPVLYVAADMADESAHGVERAAAHGLPRKDAEPSFHEVDPRSALWGEVKVHSWMSFKPGADLRSRVGGGVVEDDVEFFPAEPTDNFVQESEKVCGGVSLAAFAKNLPTRYFQSGIQANDPVASVVVCLSCREAGA